MAIKHLCDEWVLEWCEAQGWTDLFVERASNYWAFPPAAVMPVPIPTDTLLEIKAAKGMSREERLWSSVAVGIAGTAAMVSCLWQNPLPLTFAFAAVALIIAYMED
jgi:hypothetical protein